MYFRFGSAVFLVVLIAMAGVAIEKRTLKLRREVSRQYYRTEVLLERHATLRLRTQQLASPVRVVETIEQNNLMQLPAEAASAPEADLPSMPLLRWQRAARWHE